MVIELGEERREGGSEGVRGYKGRGEREREIRTDTKNLGVG